jgi:hypothetical protein
MLLWSLGPVTVCAYKRTAVFSTIAHMSHCICPRCLAYNAMRSWLPWVPCENNSHVVCRDKKALEEKAAKKAAGKDAGK